ncbi:hypothetical protein BDZ91DRAFT_724056, partial [Kalaharituber pfeilii]
METGRWKKIRREDRLCLCAGGVQTEWHVVVGCPFFPDLRDSFWEELCVKWRTWIQISNLVLLYSMQH